MLLGYFEFVILLFLPGLSMLLLFNQVKEGSLLSVLARSYGISLALNSVVMFAVMTWGNSSLGASIGELTGFHFPTVPRLILGISLIITGILAYVRLHSRMSAFRLPRISRGELAVLFIAIVSGALILSQFIKYPIFPKSYSADFLVHFGIIRDIADFRSSSGGSSGLLYYGVHYNLALGYLLVGGEAFVQSQYLMAILVAPSSLIIYEASRMLYDREDLAILAQILFVVTGFLWYVSLYNTGLYPNLFAILLSFTYIAEFKRVLQGQRSDRFVAFSIVAFSLYLSHYFTPIFLGAVAGTVLVGVVTRAVGFRRVIVPMAITFLPLSVLLIRSDLLEFALRILGETQTIGAFTFSTPFADFFSFNPFTRYIIAEIYNTGSLLIFFGLPFALYYVWRHKKDAWTLISLPTWLILIWLLAPNGELAWRFSFQGLAPLILLCPATFVLVPRLVKWVLGFDNSQGKRRRETRRAKGRYPLTEGLTVALLLLMVSSGSWTNIMIYDLSLDTHSYANAQVDLYDAMIWFSHNTPHHSTLLSVTDWRVAFLEPLTTRVGELILFAPAPDAIAYAKSHGHQYLLVTYYIPASAPPFVDLPAFYHSFENNQNLRIVYQNAEDTIYQIVK